MSPDPASPRVVVTDAPDASRYEARLVPNDGPANPAVAFAAYVRRPGAIVFTHTEVPPALEGRGVGSRLARDALDDARRRGLAVIPRCPFVAAYIRRHPEYRDLVPADRRDELLGTPDDGAERGRR